MLGCQQKGYRLRIRWATKGKGTISPKAREAESTEAILGDGPARSSEEISVMETEQRGWVIPVE